MAKKGYSEFPKALRLEPQYGLVSYPGHTSVEMQPAYSTAWTDWVVKHLKASVQTKIQIEILTKNLNTHWEKFVDIKSKEYNLCKKHNIKKPNPFYHE